MNKWMPTIERINGIGAGVGWMFVLVTERRFSIELMALSLACFACADCDDMKARAKE